MREIQKTKGTIFSLIMKILKKTCTCAKKKDENSHSQDHILTDLANTFTWVVQMLPVHLKISPSTYFVFMYHSPFPINCALHDTFEPEGQVVELQNDVSSTFLFIILGFSISAMKLGVRGVVAALLY